MTTSQRPRYGRHARPDAELTRDVPSGPAASALPVQRGAPAISGPSPRVAQTGRESVHGGATASGAPASDTAARPLTVGEYASGSRDSEPGFGEWPYGPSRRDPAPPAPVNPYLPTDGATSDVALPPGGWPGTAAMVVGVAGVALAMAPITAVVVWPLTILGVILGVLGVRRVRAGTARNGVTAVVGTVFCTAALAVCGAWIALYTMAGLNTAPPAQADTPTSQVR